MFHRFLVYSGRVKNKTPCPGGKLIMREKLGLVLALGMFIVLMVAPATSFAQRYESEHRGCYHECAREYRHCENRCNDLQGHHRKDCFRRCEKEQRHCEKDCDRHGHHR